MKKWLVFSIVLIFSSSLWATAQWSHNPEESQMILSSTINPVMVSDGFGGAIVVGEVLVTHRYLVAQRVDRDGYILWDESLYGIPVAQKGLEDVTAYPYLLPDGYGGVFVAYSYMASPLGEGDVYVQHIDSSGVVLWGDRGVPVCTRPGYQGPIGIVTNGEGGMIVVWANRAGGDTIQTYAQRVSGDGEILWEVNGVFVSNKRLELAVTDGAGGAIMMPDYGAGGQRINGNGELLWNEEEIDAGVGRFREMAADGSGNVILSGRKTDELGLGLFVQKMNGNGNLLWEEGGIRISPMIDDQIPPPKIVTDSLNMAFFAWRDRRTGYLDVYAQKINEAGEFLWDSLGVTVSDAAGIRGAEIIIHDNLGGAIICYGNAEIEESGIYAQKISQSGVKEWNSNGVYISPAAGYDRGIISDANGGAIISWYLAAERRGVYIKKIDKYGILGGGSKGDLNGDGNHDVVDLVRVVNIILGIPPSPTEYELWSADLNDDGAINVLDAVLLVNKILEGD